jgi:hypothetical protein
MAHKSEPTLRKSDIIFGSSIQWKLDAIFGANSRESAPATTEVKGKWTFIEERLPEHAMKLNENCLCDLIYTCYSWPKTVRRGRTNGSICECKTRIVQK